MNWVLFYLLAIWKVYLSTHWRKISKPSGDGQQNMFFSPYINSGHIEMQGVKFGLPRKHFHICKFLLTIWDVQSEYHCSFALKKRSHSFSAEGLFWIASEDLWDSGNSRQGSEGWEYRCWNYWSHLGRGLCYMPQSFQWEAWLHMPPVCRSLLGGLSKGI